jgi:hypothetical protein
MADHHPEIVALGARVHLFARPLARQRLRWLFEEVLGCSVVERDFGLADPIMLVRFADGSAFSVEFTELAPPDVPPPELDDEHAFRGAWIEFRTRTVVECQDRLRNAGIPEFRHRGSEHVYFSAPGGQVFRLVDVDYRGP